MARAEAFMRGKATPASEMGMSSDIQRLHQIDRSLGLNGEIPSFPGNLIQTTVHEFGHVLVADKYNLNVAWVSTVPDFNSNPPYLGVTRFVGKIPLNVFQVVVAAGEAVAGSKGTGGDRMQSAMVDMARGGTPGVGWRGAVMSAEGILGPIDKNLWGMAARVFLAAGGEGGMAKVKLAFERAELALKIQNEKQGIETSQSPFIKLTDDKGEIEEPDRRYSTEVITGVHGEVRFREYNLITGNVKEVVYYPCCGGENAHKPNCKHLNDSKEKQEDKNVSDRGKGIPNFRIIYPPLKMIYS